MMSRITASKRWAPIIASASRPPGHLTGHIPSIRSRVSTSSAMMGWSSTMRMRGFCSESLMGVDLLRSSRSARLAQDIRGLYAGRDEPLEVAAAEPGGTEVALHGPLRADPRLHELEEVLELDLIALHAGDLADLDDLARPVRQARHLDDRVDGRAHLVADRLRRDVDAGHQHERLHAVQAVARRVGVDGGDRAVVAGVHGLEHVERLGAPD